jgi:hypothetical protein
MKTTLTLSLAAALVAASVSFCASAKDAGCTESADWLAKRTDHSTAFKPITAELVVYANGCVKAVYPAGHVAEGTRWTTLPAAEVDALVAQWEKVGAYALSKATLSAERLTANKAAGGHVAPTVWDASVTELQLRHPRTKAATDVLSVYALANQPAAKGGAWAAIQSVGNDLSVLYRATAR